MIPRLGIEPDVVRRLDRLLDPALPGSAWARSAESVEWSAHLPPDVGVGLRLFLDPERVRAVLAQEEIDTAHWDPMPVSITVELVEQMLPRGVTSLTASVGAWASRPVSEQLCPTADAEPPTCWAPQDVPDILDGVLYRSARLFAYMLSGGLALARPTLRERQLQQPLSYLLLPNNLPESPEAWLGQSPWGAAITPILRRVLVATDAHDERLAAGVDPSGTLSIYRRLEPSATPDTVGYFLFLPSGQVTRGEWEVGAGEFRQIFEQFDDYVAWTLWDVDTELEMLRDRLGDLQSVAASASDRLNPLLRELLNPQSRTLTRVRDAVELIRATLIQGGPELTDYRRRVQRERFKVDQLREMFPSFAHGAGLRRIDDLPSIIDRLLEPVERQRQELDESLVSTSQDVDSLVSSAAAVLAERREQTLADLSRMAFTFNVVLLFFAVGTAVDLLVEFKWSTPPSWLELGLRVVVLVVVVAATGAMAWMWLRRRTHGSRSDDVEALRRRAVDFVQRVGLNAAAPVDDLAAATELAGLLDDLDSVDVEIVRRLDAPGSSELPTGWVVDYIVRRAESWSVLALLLVERPFPLTTAHPLVASLYHFRWNGQYVSRFEFNQALAGRPEVDAFRSAGLERPRTESAKALLDWIRENMPRLEPRMIGQPLPDQVGPPAPRAASEGAATVPHTGQLSAPGS